MLALMYFCARNMLIHEGETYHPFIIRQDYGLRLGHVDFRG